MVVRGIDDAFRGEESLVLDSDGAHELIQKTLKTSGRVVCGVCGQPIEDTFKVCPSCEAPHHEDCWDYNAGCAVFGCRSSTPVTVRLRREERDLLLEELAAGRRRIRLWRGLAGLLGLAALVLCVRPYLVTAPAHEAALRSRVLTLTYVPEGFPLKIPARSSGGIWPARFDEGPPPGSWTLPPPGKGPRFWGELTLGARERPHRIPFLIDREGPGHVRLWVDANGDRDLTNDAGPFEDQGTFEKGRISFGRALDLEIPQGSSEEPATAPYRIWVFLNQTGWDQGRISFYSLCHWRGQLTSGTSKYAVALFDNPADGDYRNDSLVVDLDGDGRAGTDEYFRPPDRIRLGPESLTLRSLSPSGRRIEILVDADAR